MSAQSQHLVDFELGVTCTNELKVTLPGRLPLDVAFTPGGIEGRIRDELYKIALLVEIPKDDWERASKSGQWRLARQALNQMLFSTTPRRNQAGT